MSLGLTKDSMLNLAELAREKEEEDEAIMTPGDAHHADRSTTAPTGESTMEAPSSTGGGNATSAQAQAEKANTTTAASRRKVLSVPVKNNTAKGANSNTPDDAETDVSHATQAQTQTQTQAGTNLVPGQQTYRSPKIEVTSETDHEVSPNSVISNDQSDRIGSRNMTSASPSSTSAASAGSLSTSPTENVRKQQQQPSTKNQNHQWYSGFSADYYDMHDYDNYDAYGTPRHWRQNQSALSTHNDTNAFTNLLHCIFPWTAKHHDDDGNNDNNANFSGSDGQMGSQRQQQHSQFSSARQVPTSITQKATASRAGDDDEISTGSEKLGEKLSERERHVVLARLGIMHPPLPSSSSAVANRAKTHSKKDHGVRNSSDAADGNISVSDSWHGSSSSSADSVTEQQNRANAKINAKQQKGDGKPAAAAAAAVSSGSPSASTATTRPSMNAGAPLKGILRKSSNLIDTRLPSPTKSGAAAAKRNFTKRRSLFPQIDTTPKVSKNVNVSFSPMARVVSVKSIRDMDNSEKGDIWWQKSDYEEFRKTGRMITRAMLQGGSEIWLASNQSWQMPNGSKQSTLKHALSLCEKSKQFKNGDIAAKKEYESARDKWWHMFGHSRRGLEHIASIDEGRQRQANVRTAIRAVVQEQRRQKVFQREDAEKLRMLSLQYTAWARDLATAAGHSDADAVESEFDDDSRKTREFYLLKFARTKKTAISTNRQNAIPAFMKPILSMRPDRFDVNTASQIRYRQTQANHRPPMQMSFGAAVNKSNSNAAASFTSKTAMTRQSPVESTEMLHDDNSSVASKESLAKRAAGYASGKKIGNMSAVLSGMGPEAATVGGP